MDWVDKQIELLGMTAEGTYKQTDDEDISHLSPMSCNSKGKGVLRQFSGSDAIPTCSHRMPSDISMRIDTRSAGASSRSATRRPGGLHLPPRRLESSPSNADVGGSA